MDKEGAHPIHLRGLFSQAFTPVDKHEPDSKTILTDTVLFSNDNLVELN